MKKTGDFVKKAVLASLVLTLAFLVGCGGGSGDAKADKQGQTFLSVETARDNQKNQLEWKLTVENTSEEKFTDVRLTYSIWDEQGRALKDVSGVELVNKVVNLGDLSKKGDRLTTSISLPVPTDSKKVMLDVVELGSYANGRLDRSFSYGASYPFEIK